jgi:hypothetical protein
MGRHPKPKPPTAETSESSPAPKDVAAAPLQQNSELEAQLAADTSAQPETAGEAKRKQGRPRKNKEAEPVQETIIPTAADPIYTGMILAVGLMVTSRACPTMPVTQEEAERISLPLTQVMAHIAPGMLPVHMACLHLTFAVIGVSVPRVFEAVRLADEKKQKQPHHAPTMADSTDHSKAVDGEIVDSD